jgi:3-polyprenyl-4-hydroxybenzoate decarboxylase
MPYPWRSVRDWILEEEKLGNVVRTETPIKCGDYNNIIDIGNGIPGKIPETEVRAFVRYLHSLPGKPIGIIEKPVDNRPDIPVVVNPWPSRERVLRGMGLNNNSQLNDKIADIPNKRIKSTIVSKSQAPCKQIIIDEENLDLRHDIPRIWVEFNQWLWTGCNGTIIIRDPDTGAHSLGKLRFGPYEWQNANPDTPFPEERVKHYGVATMSPGGPRPSNTANYYRKHRAQGKPMPGVYAFGLPTDTHVLAAVKSLDWPRSGDEYEALGGWREEPIEIVESETIPGLMVPSQAEWIIEGEFLSEDQLMPPYGEDQFVGHMIGGMSWPIFKAKCISRQKDTWWTATTFSSSGLNGREGPHSALAIIKSEADALRHLRSLGFRVKDVCTLAGSFMTIIQLEVDGLAKPYPNYGQKVGMALQTYIQFIPAKYIIVVGPDTDPYDPIDVLWTLAMQTDPVLDTLLIKQGMPGPVDILGVRHDQQRTVTTGGQAIIDATIPVPERYDNFQPRCEPPIWEKEAIKKMQKKIGSVI